MTSLPKCIVNTKGKPFVLFHKICYESYITAFCFTTFHQSDRETDTYTLTDDRHGLTYCDGTG